MSARLMALVCACFVGALNGTAGAVNVEMVTVGNPGNAGDTRYAYAHYGAVDHTYGIGKYEVTAGQYCAFLNAVARTDTYNLYYPMMDQAIYPDYRGCNIKRWGSPGNYNYTVAEGWANRPVNYVTWADAARFCNWLTNGQPTGNQTLATTEDGSYFINGANTNADFLTMTRKADARYVLPTQDEWVKAAYYDPSKPGGPGYWDYPTRTDQAPTNTLLSPDPGNHANFFVPGDYPYLDPAGASVGPPYWTSAVGQFTNSASAYGTFDQGGNVYEWTEAVLPSTRSRGLSGGGFASRVTGLHASTSLLHSPYAYPFEADAPVGFRVAQVPEPTALLMLAIAGLAWARPQLRKARKASNGGVGAT